MNLVARPLIALSRVIIDFVTERDGAAHPPAAGGAGLYAAAAMACWAPHVALVAGVGEDFTEVSGGIADAYGFAPEGFIVRAPNSTRSELIYHPDGQRRTERALHGPEHFTHMAVSPAQIPQRLLPAIGTYMFQDGDPAVWEALQQRRSELGTLLWEVDCALTRHCTVREFARLAQQSDIVSINLDEAQDLLGEATPQQLFAGLSGLSCAIMILRMGSQGAYVGSPQCEPLHILPPPHQVVDVTGGGNAFGGGFLAGLSERPGDIRHAARCAAAAAACAIAQRGAPSPPPPALLDRLYRTTMIRVAGAPDVSPSDRSIPNVSI